ncbi:MAG: HemK family protein methyltransferase [Patescibacteria group bacterium]|mgnify:CR=1 FL=1
MKFLNCQIDLREKVLIPRIETEFWVEKALKRLSFQKEAKPLKALDIFAGSGCIGVAVLKNIKNSRVDFVDIYEGAIKQIKINLKLNRISPKRYKIYKSDLFEKIRRKKYDVIFANPPYIATERINEVQLSVLEKEPHIALFSGEKGLDIIKIFLREAKDKSNMIFMEFDPLQKEDIKKMLEKFGYKKYQFFKDQFKKYRYLKCY